MNRSISVVTMVILMLALQGCAGFGKRTAPRVPELPEKIISAPDSTQLEITSTLLELVDDPRAAELVAEALKNNHNLKATALRLKASGLLLSQTASRRLPKIDAGYSATRDNQTLDREPQNRHKINLSLSWELDLWGKLADLHQSGRENYQAEQKEHIRAMDSLAARVLQAYFNTKANKLRLGLQQKRVQIFDNIEKTIRAKYRAGLGTLDDISSARTRTEIARSSTATSREAYASSIRELEVLLGRYPGMEMAFDGDLPEVALLSASAPAAILKNRPDIQAAMNRFKSLQSSSRASHKEMLPNITLSADIFRDNPTFGKLDTTPSSWGLIGSILYPVFNANRLKNEAKAADAQTEAAGMEYASVIIQAMKEVENAFGKEKHLKNRLKHLQKAIRHAKQSSRYYEMRYREGIADIIQLNTIREQELSVMSDIIDTRAARILNRVDMALALGTGVMRPEKESIKKDITK